MVVERVFGVIWRVFGIVGRDFMIEGRVFGIRLIWSCVVEVKVLELF